jgi:hypothetical protein
MEHKQFPIPKSGQVKIVPTGPDAFDIECAGVNAFDNQQLMGFFGSMKGRFGEFRFEHAGQVHLKFRFDSDSVPFTSLGTDKHNVTFPVKILS